MEKEQLSKLAEEIIEVMKRKKLTYEEAKIVLFNCEHFLDKSIIS